MSKTRKNSKDSEKDESVIHLSKDEWDRLIASLERPAKKPSKATEKAMEIFKQGRNEGERMVFQETLENINRKYGRALKKLAE